MPGRVKLSSTNHPNDDCGIVKRISQGPGKQAAFRDIAMNKSFFAGLVEIGRQLGCSSYDELVRTARNNFFGFHPPR
jgi:hypothetical protein